VCKPSSATKRRTPERSSRDMLARQRTVTRTVYGIPEQLEIWRCGDNAVASITIRQARVLFV
jgi:hypothetical protein